MSFPTRAVPRRGHGTSVCPGRASPLEHYNPPSFYQTASPGNFHAARKGLHGDYLGRWCSPAAAECPPVPLSVRPSVFPLGGRRAGPGRRLGRAEGRRGGREKEKGGRGGREGGAAPRRPRCSHRPPLARRSGGGDPAAAASARSDGAGGHGGGCGTEG